MMTWGRMTIPVGARGFDALGDPTTAARLGRDGWRFRTFYICQAASTRLDGSKITENDLTSGRRRIADHINAGLGVILNFESAADRWTAGYGAGRVDGQFSAFMCAQLGYPDGLAVIASWDTDTRVNGRVSKAAIDYGHGFNDGLGARWTTGVYAGTPTIAALADVCAFGWQAMASFWSPPGVSAVVHAKQRRPTSAETARMPYATAAVLDVNDARLPFWAWGVADVAPPPPPIPVPGGPATYNPFHVFKES